MMFHLDSTADDA